MNAQRVYHALLRLYPARFRAAYADEMQQVFRHALEEDSSLGLYWREFTGLLAGAAREHLRERFNRQEHSMKKTPTQRQIRLIRYLVRAVSLAAILWFLYPLFVLLPNNPHLAPLVAVFVLALVSALMAWAWERAGGVALMVCGTLAGLAGLYGTYAYEASQGEVILWAVLLAGAMWGFPFIAFGWLFVKLSQTTTTLDMGAPQAAR
jgi:hypothetical protein